MKLPKIVIFDVGGTLSSGKWENSELGYRYLYEEILDVNESLDDFLKFIREMLYIINQRETCDLEFSFKSFFNYLKDLYGLKTTKQYEEIEYNFLKKFYKPIRTDNALEILNYFKRKSIPMYVLSNSMYSSNLIAKELEDMGIKHYFKQIISSGDHLVRKPSKELFKLYLKKFDMMGYKTSDICYIGNDYYFDIKSPIELGMMCVHLSDKTVYHDQYLEVNSYLKLIEELEKNE